MHLRFPLLKVKKQKNFVEDKLSTLDFIDIKTYRPDKYSRYLVDVFYSNEFDDLSSIINNGNFLNQELLDNPYHFLYIFEPDTLKKWWIQLNAEPDKPEIKSKAGRPPIPPHIKELYSYSNLLILPMVTKE